MVGRIDAHHHFWRIDDGHCIDWLPQEPAALQRDFLPDDFDDLIARADVHSTILVQAARREAETEWLLDLMARTSSVLGVVGWVDPLAPGAADRVRAWRSRGLVGIRLWNQADPDCTLLDAYATSDFFAACNDDLPFDLLVRTHHLPAAVRLVERHEAKPYIIDHAAKPDIAHWRPGDAAFTEWADGLRRMAAAGDVYCKFSGLITEASDRWAVSDLKPYYETLLDIFTPARLVWGSDWPVLLKAGNYTIWAAVAQELAADLSAEERAAIFHDNAVRFYLG